MFDEPGENLTRFRPVHIVYAGMCTTSRGRGAESVLASSSKAESERPSTLYTNYYTTTSSTSTS